MTQEEKAKRYDEAIERAKNYHSPETECNVRIAMENLFPELAESEDERIRKAILGLTYIDGIGPILTKYSVTRQDIRAYLEKQSEQKPMDKVEPKFKTGDSIKTANEEPLTITEVSDRGYWSEDLFICSFDDAAKWELVEQKPAWSEEDEEHLNSIISDIKTDMRAYPRSQEVIDIYNDDISFLKSLKDRVQPQNTWKPTGVQMKALRSAIHSYGTHCGSDPLYHVVLTLEKDLRAL